MIIKTLKGLWKTGTDGRSNAESLDITLAVTALMVEVMMMDGRLDDAERNEIVAALKARFGLTDNDARKQIDRATVRADKSHDLHQFTSRIINEYPFEERADIIRELWQVAMADGHVDAYEEQLIRKIADLIGVSHRDFIDTKFLARNNLHSGSVQDQPVE